MAYLIFGIILVGLGFLDLINRKSTAIKIAQKKAGWTKYLMPLEFIVGAFLIVMFFVMR